MLGGETFHYLSANQEEHARSDIRARGFWGSTHQFAFFDIKVFDPNAESYRRSSLDSCYKREKKKLTYEQRILDVEHGTFTPLVFNTSGGVGAYLDILCPSCPPPIHQMTDQICNNNGLIR